MSDLFTADNDFKPLADRMRPQSLDQVFGQQHLLGPGKPLRLAIEANKLHSMIFWGPPGTGKTTIARLIAQYSDARFITLSAVLAGVKDIREAIEQARQFPGLTVLFIDEVHRFNKAQQDAFLPHIEDGTILFVGATTENPSFELNNALLSQTLRGDFADEFGIDSVTLDQVARNLQKRQRATRVAIGGLRQQSAGFVVEFELERAEAPVRILDSAPQHALDVFTRDRFEDIGTGSR